MTVKRRKSKKTFQVIIQKKKANTTGMNTNCDDYSALQIPAEYKKLVH